jgi:YVTN family beta-propeller protein
MRSRLSFFLPVILAAVSALPLAQAQSTPRQSLLALSKRNHTLAIVDPVTLKVIAKAPVGEDPHEVIASADGKTAYVSIYGGGAYHKLSVIDLIGQKAIADIDLGPLSGPHGLTFVGGKLWFTAEGAKVIGSFDPALAKVDWVMGTGQDRTHMLWVSPDQKTIYTTNVASGTVSILEMTMRGMMGPPPGGPNGPGGPGGPNGPGSPGGQAGGPPPGADGPNGPNGPNPKGPGGPAGQNGGPNGGPPGGGAPRPNWEQTVIPVGHGDEGFDVSPDGRELWTANAQDGTVSVIDLASKKVTVTLPVEVGGANRLKFTPDGKLVLITRLGDGNLTVIDASTRTVAKRISIGHGAAGILIEPGGKRAFLSCGPDNYVAVLDLKTLEIVAKIDVGGEPDGLAWATQP